MQSLTGDEKERLRTMVRRAIESGDYSSMNQLGAKTGVGSSTLYLFMNKKDGSLTRSKAEMLEGSLTKYRSVHAPTNGHTNGVSSNTPLTAGGRLDLARAVFDKLSLMRESSKDSVLCNRIDALVTRFSLEGLEILTSRALLKDG